MLILDEAWSWASVGMSSRCSACSLVRSKEYVFLMKKKRKVLKRRVREGGRREGGERKERGRRGGGGRREPGLFHGLPNMLLMTLINTFDVNLTVIRIIIFSLCQEVRFFKEQKEETKTRERNAGKREGKKRREREKKKRKKEKKKEKNKKKKNGKKEPQTCTKDMRSSRWFWSRDGLPSKLERRPSKDFFKAAITTTHHKVFSPRRQQNNNTNKQQGTSLFFVCFLFEPKSETKKQNRTEK